MKKFLPIIFLIPVLAIGQTKTTEDLDKKYEGMSLFFYKNTLKMLNQKDSKEFDELIKDIEKMRFLMIDKSKQNFTLAEYTSLKKKYHGENYEEMMTTRMDGKNFDVLIRESGGNVKGTVILASDSTNLYVLDILGKVALNKAGSLFNSLDQSTDIGQKIKDFATGGKDKKKLHKESEDEDDEIKKAKKN